MDMFHLTYHNAVLFSFMTYHRVSYKSVTCGAGTATLPEHLSSSTKCKKTQMLMQNNSYLVISVNV